MHHPITASLLLTLCITSQLTAMVKITARPTVTTPAKMYLDGHYQKAIEQDNVTELTRLLSLAIKPNINALYDLTLDHEEHQFTLLMLAAYMRSVGTTDLLLQHGALTDIHNKDGMTALMYAVGPSYEQTTYGKYTIENVEDEVAEHGSLIAQQLLKASADVNAQDNEGKTALMHVASHPRPALAELLVEHGALVNQRDVNNYTAVMHAAERGSIAIALLLLYKAQAICTNTDIEALNINYDRAKRITMNNLLERYQQWINANPQPTTLPADARKKLYLEQYEREEKQALVDFEEGSSRKIRAPKHSSNHSSDAHNNSEEKKQENKQPASKPVVAAKKGSASWCIIG